MGNSIKKKQDGSSWRWPQQVLCSLVRDDRYCLCSLGSQLGWHLIAHATLRRSYRCRHDPDVRINFWWSFQPCSSSWLEPGSDSSSALEPWSSFLRMTRPSQSQDPTTSLSCAQETAAMMVARWCSRPSSLRVS